MFTFILEISYPADGMKTKILLKISPVGFSAAAHSLNLFNRAYQPIYD